MEWRPLFAHRSRKAFRNVALIVLVTPAALAQQSPPPNGPPVDCLARIPPSAFKRVPVYLETAPTDSQSSAMLAGVDALTQVVVERVRSSLGAKEGQLPPGDSVLGWHQLDGVVSLTVYADGRFSWSSSKKKESIDPFFRPSTSLLEQVLRAALDAGERVFMPDGFVFDSATFEMYYLQPSVSSEGEVQPITARAAIPAFSLSVPWMRPALAIQQPRAEYPEYARAGGAEGVVLLQFVIDTLGRPELHTLREIGHPQLSGELARYYAEFLAAAMKAVKQATFSAAEIGGCPVRQLVQLPFVFRLKR